jgi:hypothetical protein
VFIKNPIPVYRAIKSAKMAQPGIRDDQAANRGASQTARQAGAGNPAMRLSLTCRDAAERDRYRPAGAAGTVDPDREKDIPKIPLRCTSGSGGGAASACGGGGGGAGKLSHFIEYTSWPSAVRPIGAQLSTRAVAFLGVNLVCAQAGDAINRMANTSFFIGFLSRGYAQFNPY